MYSNKKNKVKEYYLDDELVHYFVSRVSNDKNPIHMKKGAIIPGDLLSTLYLKDLKEDLNKGKTLKFNNLLKCPKTLVFNYSKDNEGIYEICENDNKKVVEVDNFYCSKVNKLFYSDNFKDLDYDFKNTKEALKKFFYIFYDEKIGDNKNLDMLILVNFSTKFINNNIFKLFDKDKLKTVVYKSHSFKKYDEYFSDIFYVNLRAEELKKDRYLLDFEFIKANNYVNKEIIVSGKASEKLNNFLYKLE